MLNNPYNSRVSRICRLRDAWNHLKRAKAELDPNNELVLIDYDDRLIVKFYKQSHLELVLRLIKTSYPEWSQERHLVWVSDDAALASWTSPGAIEIEAWFQSPIDKFPQAFLPSSDHKFTEIQQTVIKLINATKTK